MHTILVGPPGSGKSTLAKALCEKNKMKHLSTGQLFRDMRKADSELAKSLREIPLHGYVPDEMTNSIVQEYLQNNPGDYILDGYPRTIEQFEFAKEHIKKIIILELDEDNCRQRLLQRKERNEADVIEERIQDFNNFTKPMIEHIKKQQQPIIIDAKQSQEQMQVELFKQLSATSLQH